MLLILAVQLFSQIAFSAQNSCLGEIESKICVTALAPRTWPDPAVQCGRADSGTVTKIKAIAQDFSDPFQKILCGLDKIFIIDEQGGSAFGGYTQDSAGHFHSFLGLYSVVLNKASSLSSWASWKEQLSFGGSSDSSQISSSLPVIQAEIPGVYSDFLFFVLSHEMGHILDFANHVRTQGCGSETDCEMDSTGFGHFSWKTLNQIRPSSDFSERSRLCFYGCHGQFLDWVVSTSIYKSLYQAGFISLYSSTNSADDFAESVAFYNISQIPGVKYRVQTPQGESYYPLSEFQSGILAEKNRFIEKLLQRTDLIFGGK